MFWTEQILPEGWMHGFVLMIEKVQVKFVEGDISVKSLLMKVRSLILKGCHTVCNLFIKVGWKTVLFKFIASSACKCRSKLK